MSAEANAQDPYTYRGTTVLINKRGYETSVAARLFETDAVARRSGDMPDAVRRGALDAGHFRAIHRHLFQDVYDWAGQYRSVNFSKDQTAFARASTLDAYGERIFSELAKDKHLQGLEKPAFVDKLTKYYSEINAWHPFREGNGRTTRAFFDSLARQAGYRLDLRQVEKGAWNHAAERSAHGELQPMKDIFTKSVRPIRALAFEVMERFTAIQRFPELQGAFDMVDAVARKTATQYPNNRQARDRFAAQARNSVQLMLDAGKVPNPQALTRTVAPAVAQAIKPLTPGRAR